MIRTVVLTGSVRNGRIGPEVTRWFTWQAATRADLDLDVVDLADHSLPLDLSPAPETRDALAARLAAADAFVVVTPEYNHSYPAALKNVLDWYLDEWAAKPVGFVSYGGVAGGLRAVEHLRAVFAELHAVTVRETVSFHFAELAERTSEPAAQVFGGDRHLVSEGAESAVKALLDQLTWWARALRTARAEHPYQR
jgi:NAD(P)H-dependent FMN reductase